MIADTPSDCIDSNVTELVELFRGQLAELRFPGVDATTLDVAVAAVRERADDVDRLRTALADAVEAMRTEQRALREHARQALAYARVFASGDTALAERLDGIALDEPKLSPPKRRRGRRAKAAEPAPQLALDGEPADARATEAA